jgi:hypothetical protein
MAIETMLQVVEQIPKSPSGKFLRRILEEVGRAALPDAYWGTEMSTTMSIAPTMTLPSIPASRRLADRVVLVTGANRGFGRLLAGTLAGAGAAVGLVARSAEQLAETRDELIEGGGTAVAVAADVSDPETLRVAVEEVSRQLGPIDVLINNAGVTGPVGAVWEVDSEDWWCALEVNLRSVFT